MLRFSKLKPSIEDLRCQETKIRLFASNFRSQACKIAVTFETSRPVHLFLPISVFYFSSLRKYTRIFIHILLCAHHQPYKNKIGG